MIIAVDFDGTLHTGIYPNIGEPAKDAARCLHKLHKDGHTIILWTCRTGEHLAAAINWLKDQDIPFDRVNDNDPKNIQEYNCNTRKIYADVYIDDKQVGGLPSWIEILKLVDPEYELYNGFPG